MDEAFLFSLDVMDFLKKPSVVETMIDILLCAVPIWLAVMIGLMIGWSWRPRWTGLVYLGLRSKLRFLWTIPPGFGARRLWLAFTALSAFSVCRTIWSRIGVKAAPATAEQNRSTDSIETDSSPIDETREREQDVVTETDVEHLIHLLQGQDGEMEWQSLMDRTAPNMEYQAWQHEPETGPVVYRSRTVFEDATPEVVRDFFWDDEFRPKWDRMLAYFKILEENPHSGTMIVRWVKKFPFFCSDREYIFGRRIWEGGNTYYCVTKGVPYPALPKRDKPRRVEHYFSSWVIRAVESRKGDGQQSACEVTLFHYEDMGIPKDVAKLGVRHGMWGTVKKLNSGLRAYQNAQKSDTSLSRCALMARITTKLNMNTIQMTSTGREDEDEEDENRRDSIRRRQKEQQHGVDWKWVVVGGVALACGLHSGAIGKALLAGAGGRLARR